MCASPAVATPPEGTITRTDLATFTVTFPTPVYPAGPSKVVAQHLVLSPGSSSGWHTHPGIEFTVVTGGSVSLQTPDTCGGVTYSAGQVVVIPAGAPHYVQNVSGADAEAIATYTVGVGAPVRLDAPNACAG